MQVYFTVSLYMFLMIVLSRYFTDHDSMNPIKVDGYESKCEFYQEVTYDSASITDIVALVDASVECKQFVSWNCISATINHPLVSSYTLTYWLNRDYQDVSIL